MQVNLRLSLQGRPRSNGQDGPSSPSAFAVFPGVSGNIAANALNTTCCGDQVTISNPAPFAGGADSQLVHVVTQADLDRVKNTLYAQLRGQVLHQLQKKLTTNDVEAVQPTYITKDE